MNDCRRRSVNGDARFVSRKAHVLARLFVAAVLASLWKIFKNSFHRVKAKIVGHGISGAAGVAFHRVAKRVHAGGHRNALRRRDCVLVIDYGDFRQKSVAFKKQFFFRRRVGKDKISCHLGTGAGRRRYQYQRREISLYLFALVVGQLSWKDGHRSNRLGGVERRSPAKPDDKITLFGLKGVHAGHNHLVGRLARQIVEQGRIDSQRSQKAGNLFCQASFCDDFSGDNQSLFSKGGHFGSGVF